MLAVAPIKMFPRYRKEIGAEDISIVCDIKKKHSAHAVTADVRWQWIYFVSHSYEYMVLLSV